MGSVAFWRGMWSLLRFHLVRESVWREVGYIAVGCLLFLVSDTPLIEPMELAAARAHSAAASASASVSVSAIDEVHSNGESTIKRVRFRSRANSLADVSRLSLSDSMLMYLRSVVALTAAVVSWTGVEDLLENYIGT